MASRTSDEISSALCRRGRHSGCPWIEGEVAARKGAVRALGLVHQFHVRLDSTFVHQPPNHLGRAVTRVGDQARQSDSYLVIWGGFSALAALAQWLLVRSGVISEMGLAIGDRRIAGILLIAAGLYQATP